jgi:glyoxylase-like metal-dependent hydrolase (beta-lactamase superfamily II)
MFALTKMGSSCTMATTLALHMQFKIISIGALAINPLWGERAPARTGHATTTLVTSGEMRILVDPGLPAQALSARLAERANMRLEDITHVFLTQFHPDCRRAIESMEKAKWLISSAEREAVGVHLAQKAKHLAQTGDQGDLLEVLKRDLGILQRCEEASDHLADGVDLFPLPGISPGLCGLLLGQSRHTTLICGDAVPTQEHLEQGKTLPNGVDITQAKESVQEAVEIADLLVLGRDNVVVNPTKRAF